MSVDFHFVNVGRDYRLDALTERARAYIEALPREIPRPVEFDHDGWLPLALALQREGYIVNIIDRE